MVRLSRPIRPSLDGERHSAPTGFSAPRTFWLQRLDSAPSKPKVLVERMMRGALTSGSLPARLFRNHDCNVRPCPCGPS